MCRIQSEHLVNHINAKRFKQAIFSSSIEMNFFLFTLCGFIGILNEFQQVTSDSPNTQIYLLKVTSHSNFIVGEVSAIKVEMPRCIHPNNSK